MQQHSKRQYRHADITHTNYTEWRRITHTNYTEWRRINRTMYLGCPISVFLQENTLSIIM